MNGVTETEVEAAPWVIGPYGDRLETVPWSMGPRSNVDRRGDPLACPLAPRRVVNSIFDLDPRDLASQGIRLVMCDLDNTLVPYEEALPSPALRSWKAALEGQGIALYVVSNSRKSRRCPDFCAALGIPCVRHAGKPGRKGFLQALEETGVPADRALMVGDQIFTDIWGANRAGVCSVLVRPIAWGKNPLRRVRYAIEAPFRWAGKRKWTP